MESEKILSICIPSHNRVDILLKNLVNILKIKDNRFDIIITDTSDQDSDYEKLLAVGDPRVKIFRNDANASAMENWFCALEHADGRFAFHLNDRDKLIVENFTEFITFLEGHMKQVGGVCKYMPDKDIFVEYHGLGSTVMNMPYFALHTTGMVFQTECFRKISDRREIFTRERSGCHPHDVILGRLAVMGDMFLYTKHVWEMASAEFYKKNLSGAGMMQFFEPEERLFELKCCLRELEHLNGVGKELRRAKQSQMIKNYLNLSTLGYFHHTESEHEALHYGSVPKKYSFIQKKRFVGKVLVLYRKELGLSKKMYVGLKKWTYHNFFIGELAKKCSRIKEGNVRKVLRKMNEIRKSRDDAILR